MEKSNKTERNKIIDETFNDFANGSIKILSEALAEKDTIINY
ncbi:805_t:CDS:1, partial [Ambispora leptoticha]